MRGGSSALWLSALVPLSPDCWVRHRMSREAMREIMWVMALVPLVKLG